MKHESLTKDVFDKLITNVGITPLRMSPALRADKNLHRYSYRLVNFNYYILRRLEKIRKGVDYHIKKSVSDTSFEDILITSCMIYDFFLTMDENQQKPVSVRCELTLKENSSFSNTSLDGNFLALLESSYYNMAFSNLVCIIQTKPELQPAFLLKGDLIRLTDSRDLDNVLASKGKNCKLSLISSLALV